MPFESCCSKLIHITYYDKLQSSGEGYLMVGSEYYEAFHVIQIVEENVRWASW